MMEKQKRKGRQVRQREMDKKNIEKCLKRMDVWWRWMMEEKRNRKNYKPSNYSRMHGVTKISYILAVFNVYDELSLPLQGNVYSVVQTQFSEFSCSCSYGWDIHIRECALASSWRNQTSVPLRLMMRHKNNNSKTNLKKTFLFVFRCAALSARKWKTKIEDIKKTKRKKGWNSSISLSKRF